MDATRFGTRSYRSQLGVVMPDDDLFTGSILENIAVDQRPDLDRVREAASMACVHQEIEELPMGYLTLIVHMGSALSGGQKHTAHLNDELQSRVLQNLRTTGATILAATHDDRVVR